MATEKTRSIFLDIDGALIDGADGPFPDDVALLEAAREAGNEPPRSKRANKFAAGEQTLQTE
ncbi:MAG: hypothetical protein LBF83_00355 [Spirochaetaceae bacterium]|nr:hypothetical protein [Spirochaetaceae bacterium]